MDRAPVLILWFFDSRGQSVPSSPLELSGIYKIAGGRYPNPNSTVPVPDWVDATVADWIKCETEKMEAAWGPSDRRGAVAFVHIPPYVIISWTCFE